MHAKPVLRAATLIVAAAASAVAVRAADWKLLPHDVHAAVHLDMKALATSELYRALLERHPENLSAPSGNWLALVQATGFDLREDLETLTVGAGGEPNDPEAPFYAILTGEFDHPKIEAWVRDSGEVSTGSFEGLRTYLPSAEVDSGPPPTAAFIDERTLILASSPDFPKLVAAVRGSGASSRETALGRLLSTAQGQLRVAVEIPASFKQVSSKTAEPSPGAGLASMMAQLQSPAAGPMRNLQSVVLALDARTGLDLALRAAADSPESGKLIHDALAGYLMLGRAMSAQNPQLGGMLDRLQLEQQGSTVRVSLSLSADEITAAIDQAAGAGSSD